MKVLIERALYSVIEVEVKDWNEAQQVVEKASRGEMDEEFDHHTNDNSNYTLVDCYD